MLKHNKHESKVQEDMKTKATFKQNHGSLNECDDALRMIMIEDNEDFERKIELGCKAKNIMFENSNLRIAAMSKEIQEAIELYDRYGQNTNNKQITWRGWQQELRSYLDDKCDRKIFWIIGRNGNEGKSFFQENIREEFGYAIVCYIYIKTVSHL